MTSSNGNIFRVTGPLWGELTGHRWIPLTTASYAELWCFLLISARINGWENNCGDLKHNPAHYEANVMHCLIIPDVTHSDLPAMMRSCRITIMLLSLKSGFPLASSSLLNLRLSILSITLSASSVSFMASYEQRLALASRGASRYKDVVLPL